MAITITDVFTRAYHERSESLSAAKLRSDNAAAVLRLFGSVAAARQAVEAHINSFLTGLAPYAGAQVHGDSVSIVLEVMRRLPNGDLSNRTNCFYAVADNHHAVFGAPAHPELMALAVCDQMPGHTFVGDAKPFDQLDFPLDDIWSSDYKEWLEGSNYYTDDASDDEDSDDPLPVANDC